METLENYTVNMIAYQIVSKYLHDQILCINYIVLQYLTKIEKNNDSIFMSNRILGLTIMND